MDRKLGMFLNTKYIEVNEGIQKAREWDLEYIQLYAMNKNFNLANISMVEWNALKKSLSFNGIKIPSLAISFGENGIMGIEAESAIDQFKYITDRGLGLGAKIITAHIGKVPDDEKSAYYDKMLRVCYEIGDLAFKFGDSLLLRRDLKSNSIKTIFRNCKLERTSC